MKKILLMVAISIVLISLIITACSSGETKIKTYTDPAQSISASVNEEFNIALKSNPTTGYLWEIQKSDQSMIKLVGERTYQQDNAQQGMVGVGGTDTFHLQALKKGESKISFVYKRPWEPSSPQDKTAEFTIVIK